jgi:hypothetical protein
MAAHRPLLQTLMCGGDEPLVRKWGNHGLVPEQSIPTHSNPEVECLIYERWYGSYRD